MKYLRLLVLLLVLAPIVGGTHRPPETKVLCYDGDRGAAGWAWEPELRERWPDADLMIVQCHGNTRNGKWYMFPKKPLKPFETEGFARAMTKLYPGYVLVLIVCNPDKHTLNVPHVVYAKQDVWTFPDRHFNEHREDAGGKVLPCEECAGDSEDFYFTE